MHKNVRLEVYNAEPYRKSVMERLNIHLVEDSPVVIEYELMPLGADGKCVPLSVTMVMLYLVKEIYGR
ncbi:MAG: hypothetical protein QXL85_07040 [Candidatus Bathyarchaeia archaeon]